MLPPNQWLNIAKKAKMAEEGNTSSSQQIIRKTYVVLKGYQPGVYTSWLACQKQINNFPNACYQVHDSFSEAKTAFAIYQSTQLLEHTSINQISDFYNPGISDSLYHDVNGAWKSQLLNDRKQFRRHMSSLALKIKDKEIKLEKLQDSSTALVETLSWETEDFTLEKINHFLALTDLLDANYPNPIFHKLKRICLFEKIKHVLPSDISNPLIAQIEDQEVKIKQILMDNFKLAHCYEDFLPKLSIFTENPMHNLEECLEWGLVKQLIFPGYPINEFPMMIKTMIYHLTKNLNRTVYFTFFITSTVGWREREKFYQPYQLWFLDKTRDYEFEEIEDPMAKASILTINPKSYWIRSLKNFSQMARQIRAAQNQFNITDGRRIFTTNLPIDYQLSQAQKEEAQRLLTKFESRRNLDLPENLEIETTMLEEEEMHELEVPHSPASEDAEYYHNLENRMEA